MISREELRQIFQELEDKLIDKAALDKRGMYNIEFCIKYGGLAPGITVVKKIN